MVNSRGYDSERRDNETALDLRFVGLRRRIPFRGRNRRRGMGVTAMPLRWDGAFLIPLGFGRRSFYVRISSSLGAIS